MKRVLQPEWLDFLPPDDPQARRSRRDLRRVNRLMNHPALMAEAFRHVSSSSVPGSLAELGAGDGHFLLQVARRLSPAWPKVKVTLLDLQDNVSPAALAALTALGWSVETVVTDVFQWRPDRADLVVANLFLHHFNDARLVSLLDLISAHASLFVALEPRRARWPLFCSHWLWAAGCNRVTCHDAVVSVRAGFSGRELSALWPDRRHWSLQEQSAGWFSHLFIARKIN